MSKASLFRSRAAIYIRDLKEGTITRSEVPDYLKSEWDQDSDEYALDGVTDFRTFERGVTDIIDKRFSSGKSKAASAKVSGTAAKGENLLDYWPYALGGLLVLKILSPKK